MANKFLEDLRCPQYVDFLDGTDSNSGSPFFDCNEYQTPQKNPEKNSPVLEAACLTEDEENKSVPEAACLAEDEENKLVPKAACLTENEGNKLVPEAACLTEDEENKLMNKMTAALSFIESTPKLKRNFLREKLFPKEQKAPLNLVKLQETRPSSKTGGVQMLPSRIRSNTVARLDKILSGKMNEVRDFQKKRSSSLTDLRTVKKHTIPKTPLCLKRTIEAKAKAKALKTTEEMELEQITELQKHMSRMLQQNKIAYRKLNSKQRPIPTKNTETKPETSKGNIDKNADKNSRQRLKSMCPTEMKKVLKLDSIINGNFDKGASSSKALTASTVNSTKDVERSKLPSVSSSILSEDGEKSLFLFPKKATNVGFHSGVPFIFQSRIKEKNLLSSGNDENSKASSNSDLNNDISSCKENFPVKTAKSGIKIQKVKNVEYLTPKKTVGRSHRNAVRGFPLSENTNRN